MVGRLGLTAVISVLCNGGNLALILAILDLHCAHHASTSSTRGSTKSRQEDMD